MLFTPSEHTEKFSNREQNDKNFLFETEDRKYVHVGEKVFSFETTDKTVEYSSNDGLKNVKYSYAHGIENMTVRFFRKFIPFEEYTISTQKDDYVYLHKKDNEMKNDKVTVENEGIVEYGRDFLICKIIHNRDST